jgi:Tfp pilus assembly protein FimT
MLHVRSSACIRHVAPRPGVTAAELMVVIVLLGVFTALAVPRINLSGYRADASARQVRSTLQIAQRLAVTRQYDVIVSFDTINQTVRLVEDLNNNGLADSGERVSWHPLNDNTHFSTPPVGVYGAVGQSVSGPNLQTINGMPSVIFMRSGAASTDLEVYVTSLDPAPDYYRGITVTQPTGRTVYEKYLSGIWTAASI